MNMLFWLGAALGAALVSPLFAEIAARRALRGYGGYYRYVPYSRTHTKLDREALPHLRPVSRLDVNGDGERGGEPPREGERAYRILVVGGSAAECFFLDQDQTWPAVVERELCEPANLRALGVDRVHVGNVARAILPCAQIDVMLRKMLPRYRRLDAVLVMVGASDLVSWMEQGLPDTLRAGDVHLPRLFEQHPEGPWGFSPRKMALRRIAAGFYRRLRRPIEHRDNGGDWLHRTRRMRRDAPTIIDEEPNAAPMIDHFGEHLGALLRTARESGARVIVVRQPWLGAAISPEEEKLMWNFGIGRPYREQVTTYFSAKVVDALMRKVDERAVQVAEELGIEHVNLLPDIDRTNRTFYDFLHFTPEGAERVGGLVARAIVAPRVVRAPAAARDAGGDRASA